MKPFYVVDCESRLKSILLFKRNFLDRLVAFHKFALGMQITGISSFDFFPLL